MCNPISDYNAYHARVSVFLSAIRVRAIERSVADGDDQISQTVRSYCLAVRSALTDDGRPPLEASGLKLQERLTLTNQSLERVAKKGNYPLPYLS